MKLYRRLLGYVRPYKAVFGAAILGMLLVASTDVMMLQIIRPLLNNIGAIDAEHTRYLPLMIVGVFALRGLGSYASEYGLAWIGSRVVFDLRREASDHLLRLPTSFYDASSAGYLLSKITFDAQQVAATASEAVTVSIRNTLTILFMLAYLLYLNWQLTLIAFAAIPLVGIVIRQINKRLRRVSVLVQERTGALTHVLEEVIGAHRVVKVFGGEQYESGRLRKAADKLRLAMAKQAAASALGTPINQIIVSIAVGVILYAAVRQSAGGQYGPGDFVTYIFALLHLLNQLKTLGNVMGVIQRGLTAAESVFALIDEPPESDTGKVRIDRARGGIRFENVTKRYATNTRPALENIELTIAPGESVALVGPSGGGKTTLVNLIPRFYVPSAGHVLLDGQDLSTITLSDLRRQISLVSQDIVLFNDTIAANIAYGAMAGSPREAIENAAAAANALDFIRLQPNGFDTPVGERGIRLSGGQRQRIAIARAILKDAPILILDEATSALDTESERLIQIALDHVMRGRTTIVIAHRLSTIEHCDRIVVLDAGRVVEQGAHRRCSRREVFMRGCTRGSFATNELPPGRPKEGSLPLGGKARSAKGAVISLPPGRPKEGSLPLGGKARSAKGAPTVKILVIKRDKIGDLLLTTPLFTILKRSLPEVRIHVLANDYNAWVVADNPHVERVWIYRRTRHAGSLRVSAVLEQVRQFFALRGEHFDVAIAAGGEESPRAIRRALAIRAARTIAYAADGARYGARLTDPLPPPAAGHEVERMFGLATPLNVSSPVVAPLPEFTPPPRWLDDAHRWLAQVGFIAGNFVVLGLSARDASKQPSPEQALRWAQRFHDEWGCATALQSSPGDTSNALYPGSDALAQRILTAAPPYVARIPDGLPAAIGVIALARTSILPDSGLMHFAAASPGGVLGLFADTERLSSPSRWGPRGHAVALVAQRAIDTLDDAMVFAALTPLLGDAVRGT